MNYSQQEKICIYLAHREVSAAHFYAALEQTDVLHIADIADNLFGKEGKSIAQGLAAGEADRVCDELDKLGVVAVTCFSDAFPQTLRDIPDPPYALFCKGDVSLLKARCLAVVGTRKVSSYGRRITQDFVSVLAESFVIVSGLAYGVDGIAHEATLKAGGKTVAVLGGGLVNVYPAANRGLAQCIVDNGGLVLTEYNVRSSPMPYHFPHRNRLVSALSQGLLVCQSPLKSGTSSTVECALMQGRDVFAVPGEIYDGGFSGNNSLIKSMQGCCVTTPRDILDYYGLGAAKEQKQSVQLNFEEQRIVEALSDGAVCFDVLVQKTGISPLELNFLLANLEIKSIIARLPGNNYRLYGGIE